MESNATKAEEAVTENRGQRRLGQWQFEAGEARTMETGTEKTKTGEAKDETGTMVI